MVNRTSSGATGKKRPSPEGRSLPKCIMLVVEAEKARKETGTKTATPCIWPIRGELQDPGTVCPEPSAGLFHSSPWPLGPPRCPCLLQPVTSLTLGCCDSIPEFTAIRVTALPAGAMLPLHCPKPFDDSLCLLKSKPQRAFLGSPLPLDLTATPVPTARLPGLPSPPGRTPHLGLPLTPA